MVMAKSNFLARNSIEQTEQREKLRLRPYLSIHLKIVTRGGTENSPGFQYGYLFLKNTGISQAKNISVKTNPQIFYEPTVQGKKIKSTPFFIEHDTPYLAPNDSISDSIGGLAGYYERFETPIFTGTIRYFDSSKTEYKEEFILDFKSMENATPFIENKNVYRDRDGHH